MLWEDEDDWKEYVDMAAGGHVTTAIGAPAGVVTPASTLQAGTNTSPVTPKVLFTQDIKRRLDLYIKRCDAEITGLGTVEIKGDDFLVNRLFLMKQTVTGSSADPDSNAVAEVIEHMVNENIPVDKIVWWH